MKYTINDSTLTAIANAVRTKDGSTQPIAVTDLASKILAIPSGSGGGYEFTVTTGTYVPTSDIYQIDIPHNQAIKGIPLAVSLSRSETEKTTGTMYAYNGYNSNDIISDISSFTVCRRTTTSTSIAAASGSNLIVGNDYVRVRADSTARVWRSGIEHEYTIIGIKEN